MFTALTNTSGTRFQPRSSSVDFLQSGQIPSDLVDGTTVPLCCCPIALTGRHNYATLKSCRSHSTQQADACHLYFNPGNCTFSFSRAGSIGSNRKRSTTCESRIRSAASPSSHPPLIQTFFDLAVDISNGGVVCVQWPQYERLRTHTSGRLRAASYTPGPL